MGTEIGQRIESLSLSTRAHNVLKRNKIFYVHELVELDENILNGLKNIGKKTLEEILNTINMLKHGVDISSNMKIQDIVGEMTILEFLQDKNKKIINYFFCDFQNNQVQNYVFDENDLSRRTYNILKRENILSVKDLYTTRVNYFNGLKSFGEKSKTEIMDILRDRIVIEYEDILFDYIPLINQIIVEYEVSSIDVASPYLEAIVRRIIFDNYNTFNIPQNININSFECSGFIDNLYRYYELKDIVVTACKYNISNKIYDIVREDIIEGFPVHLKKRAVVDDIITELMNNGYLDYQNGMYRKVVPSIVAIMKELEPENYRTVLCYRIAGETLDEVGKRISVTRQRTRQIEIKIKRKLVRVREDDYKEIFERYSFTKESFMKIFNEPLTTFQYLEFKYSVGKERLMSLEFIINDEDSRKRLRKWLDRDYIVTETDRVKKNRQNILDYVLKTFCKENIIGNDAFEIYEMFLEDNDLNTNPKMQFTLRAFEAKVSANEKVLWKFKKIFRYIDLEGFDEVNFFESLSLINYQDMELSSLKIFRDNYELMNEWDIRDEYELHNLLKKVVTNDNEYNLKFFKMPTLKIGEPDKDLQVLELLIEMSPVLNEELASAYEERYGTKKETVLANYFGCIEEYLKGKTYSIDRKVITETQVTQMKKELTKGTYSIQIIQNLLLKIYGDDGLDMISKYNLNKLGYNICHGFTYPNEFNNLSSYIESLLTIDDIVKTNEFPDYIKNTQEYYSVLKRLKDEMTIIEFSKNKFISIRCLSNRGISKDYLLGYLNEVIDFVDSSFFTITSLRKSGFEHMIFELGFDDLFYESILKIDSRLSSAKISDNVLFATQSDQVGLSGLVEFIVFDLKSIDIYDLQTLLLEKYGLKVKKWKVIYESRNADLYYDSIMEKIYISYDEYFEEV